MCKFRDYSNYEVYEDGRIWSYKTSRFLKPYTNNKGYQQVMLYDNEGNMKMYRLHRVIWEAVTGSPIPEGLQVNHIDECKTNNHISNLNLMTPKENLNFGTRNTRASKTLSKLKKGIIPKSNPPKQVGAYKDGELVLTFHSTAEAGRNGFQQGNVAACCRNCFNRPGNNKYKGFEWRYI